MRKEISSHSFLLTALELSDDNCREHGNSSPEGAEVLLRILVLLLLGNEREPDTLRVSPPEEVYDDKVEEPQSLAEDEEVDEGIKVAFECKSASEDESDERENNSEEKCVADENGDYRGRFLLLFDKSFLPDLSLNGVGYDLRPMRFFLSEPVQVKQIPQYRNQNAMAMMYFMAAV